MRQRVARTLSTTVVLWHGVGVLTLALGALIACGSDDGEDANNGGGGGGGGKGGSGGAGGSLNLGGSGGSSASGGVPPAVTDSVTSEPAAEFWSRDWLMISGGPRTVSVAPSLSTAPNRLLTRTV